MGAIKDFLFGREIEIYDQKLGELSTKVKTRNPLRIHDWSGEHKLKGQAKPTFFILEGNIDGPDKSQKNCVYKIIDSLDEIMNQIDKFIKTQSNIAPIYEHDWMKKFYLASVTIALHESRAIQFEIWLEPIDDKSPNDIRLIWDNGKLTEIEVK